MERANEILAEYDNGTENVPAVKTIENRQQPMDSLFTSSLSEQILKLDVMSMTPIEAMNALYKLQDEARKESGR